KAEAALRAGMTALICIGETKGERGYGLAETVCLRQLAQSVPDQATAQNVVIAYEPVWAIGTGLTATIDDIAAIHRPIRAALTARFGTSAGQFRILYGGSVTPASAQDLFACDEVDGALVGGASLKAASFLEIAQAAKTIMHPQCDSRV